MTAASSPAVHLDERRWKALVEGDLDELDRLFADDMTYTHSNGLRDTKERYLGALRRGAFRYVHIDVSDTCARDFGTTTVVCGSAVVTTRSEAGELVSPLRYTAVWSLVDDEWRFVAWHSCADAA